MIGWNNRSAFVIRIWWEEIVPGKEVGWRGWVQHVHSAESIYFQEVAQLLAFLERWAGDLNPETTRNFAEKD